MKVIFSRKGFDSQYGKMPSPILPDGALLSLPIPSKIDMENRFAELQYGNQSYYDIIRSLSPNTKIKDKYYCHLDPDIRKDVKERHSGWRPAFGQEKASLSHLQNQGVGIGDLFLFFGWFRQAEYIGDRLSYVKDAPDLHIIYGYFQVGEVVSSPNNIPDWLQTHPHVKSERWNGSNVIFIASTQLNFCPELPGANCLPFSDRLILTKKGYSRRFWSLPGFFRQIPISYNANSWDGDCFVSAAKGQEFVFEANSEAFEWVKEIVRI